jgi:hypothetical protein
MAAALEARTTIDLVDRGQPAALAGRRCERRRDERRDPVGQAINLDHAASFPRCACGLT